MFPNNDDSNPYLQHEVLSATPVRLRWMLIRRAEELCTVVEQLWQANDFGKAQQWLLRIREILGELLSGICEGEDDLRKSIADFYVFLIQQVTQLEATPDMKLLGRLRELLGIELETWRQLSEKHAPSASHSNATDNSQIAAPAFASPTSSLSLEV